jgi:regulator of sigma E protease
VWFSRLVGHNERGQEVIVEMDWEDRWQYPPSAPSSLSSPVAIDALGLAYTVSTVVEGVEPDSPAARAGLKKDDVIKAVQFYDSTRTGKQEALRWLDLEPEQWARPFWLAQEEMDGRKLGLRVARRDGQTFDVVLDGEEDKQNWFSPDRGLLFEYDTRLQKADNLVDAMLMGTRRTGRLISQIYQNLLAMADGRISFPKNASGPLSIAAVSYDIAGESFQLFVLFLGMISVNLAVINFLPIPVLDGGHMVFLIYEKVRGRPAPEQVRFAATFVGLAIIGSLMLFVIYLDVKRIWF